MDAERWSWGVAEGRALARASAENKWKLADLVLELFPLVRRGTPGQYSRGDASFRAMARRWRLETEIEMTVRTLDRLRYVARAWPSARRVTGTSFAAHEILAGHPRRFSVLKPGMTTTEAKLLAGVRPQGSSWPAALAFLDACASYLRSAQRALGELSLDAERAEEIGKRVARIEAEFDDLLQRVDMADELVAA